MVFLPIGLQARLFTDDAGIVPSMVQHGAVGCLQYRVAGRCQYPMYLAGCLKLVLHVFEDMIGDNQVEGGIAERHALYVDLLNICLLWIQVAANVIFRSLLAEHSGEPFFGRKVQDSHIS